MGRQFEHLNRLDVMPLSFSYHETVHGELLNQPWVLLHLQNHLQCKMFSLMLALLLFQLEPSSVERINEFLRFFDFGAGS